MSNNIRFCSNCGSPANDDQRFCYNCGHPINVTSSEETATPAAPKVPEPPVATLPVEEAPVAPKMPEPPVEEKPVAPKVPEPPVATPPANEDPLIFTRLQSNKNTESQPQKPIAKQVTVQETESATGNGNIPPENPEQIPYIFPEKPKKNNRNMIIIFVVLGALLVAAAIWFFFFFLESSSGRSRGGGGGGSSSSSSSSHKESKDSAALADTLDSLDSLPYYDMPAGPTNEDMYADSTAAYYNEPVYEENAYNVSPYARTVSPDGNPVYLNGYIDNRYPVSMVIYGDGSGLYCYDKYGTSNSMTLTVTNADLNSSQLTLEEFNPQGEYSGFWDGYVYGGTYSGRGNFNGNYLDFQLEVVEPYQSLYGD